MIETGSSRRGQRIFLFTAIALLAACLLVDLHLTRKYGGADLRDKVIGSRSLLEGRSPYFEPWRPGDPERFADPIVPQGSELTRFTGSPFQAILMAPLAVAPYKTVRMGWLFAQYAMLVLSLLLIFKAFGDSDRRTALIALAVLAVITLSGSWRLHVERGQIYVIFTLIIAALFGAARIRAHGTIGALGAMLLLFKPTFGLLLLPLLLKITPRMVLGGLLMIVFAFLPFLFLPGGFNSWQEYAAAMKIWGAHPGEGAIPPPVPMDFEYPRVIEGTTSLAEHHSMEVENGSIPAILYAFGIEVPVLVPYLVTLLLVVGILSLYWKRVKRADHADLILMGFALYTILMMLLPVLRFHYQFVLWTAPLLYMLLRYKDAPTGWYILTAAAGVFVIGGLEILPVNVLLGEALLLLAIAIYIHTRFKEPMITKARIPAGSEARI